MHAFAAVCIVVTRTAGARKPRKCNFIERGGGSAYTFQQGYFQHQLNAIAHIDVKASRLVSA